jgi:RNA polymerase sigma-70 factor (ECF subfamily)
MEDGVLLERWRAGEREAGELLFERYFEELYRFFERKTGGDVADLVQRTFVGLVEGRERFRGESSVRTFLYAIARHELFGHFRKRRRDEALDCAVSSLHDLGPTPSAAAVARQENRLLLLALRRIPLDLQIAVELHYWEGLAGPELARILEIPEGTVRSRLRRALEMLREQLIEVAGGDAALQATLTDLDRWAAAIRGEGS